MNHLCGCSTYNRNGNAFTTDSQTSVFPEPRLYPHMRKFYNHDTDLLEHVCVTMSPIKPDSSSDKLQVATMAERRPRRTRISKQRAKVLITEYCTKKIGDSPKATTNKRSYLSLWFLSLDFIRTKVLLTVNDRQRIVSVWQRWSCSCSRENVKRREHWMQKNKKNRRSRRAGEKKHHWYLIIIFKVDISRQCRRLPCSSRLQQKWSGELAWLFKRENKKKETIIVLKVFKKKHHSVYFPRTMDVSMHKDHHHHC